MYRFFVSRESIDETAGTIRILGDDVGHIHSVLRMKPGEEILLCTGMEGDQTDYLCRIEGYSDGAVLTKIVSKNQSQQELLSRLYLFQGLPKADKLESIIQKSVELGTYRIVPTLMTRCIVKPDSKKTAKKAGMKMPTFYFVTQFPFRYLHLPPPKKLPPCWLLPLPSVLPG